MKQELECLLRPIAFGLGIFVLTIAIKMCVVEGEWAEAVVPGALALVNLSAPLILPMR